MGTLFKVAIPLVAIAAGALIVRRRRLSWRDDVGLRPVPVGIALAWAAGYGAWMLGSNAVMGWRGPWDFAPWQHASLLVDAGRVVAVGVLGPIAEELLFRGILFGWLRRAGLPAIWVVVGLAAAWAVLHTAYEPGVIVLIFVDGLLLGAARDRTRTVVVPILMHIVWNLYAVW